MTEAAEPTTAPTTTTAAHRPRVLLAEDHTLVREGLRQLLAEQLDVLDAVPDGRALLTAAEQLVPDVVLLDISMPRLNGFDAARLLAKTCPESKVIFVTMHADPDYVREAFRAGARGYVVKSAVSAELVTAVHTVQRGRIYVSRSIDVSLEGLLMPRSGKLSDALTVRQREVLQLVAEGRTAREIADALGISHKTVEFHKASVMRLLDIHTTAELTRYALEHGIIARS